MHIPGFTQTANNLLLNHEWPGNVRELQNTIERAVILTDDRQSVSAAALCLPPAGDSAMTRQLAPRICVGEEVDRSHDSMVKALADIEREHILWALEQNDGNRTRTAEMLDISIRTLRNKLNEYRVGREVPA